MTGRPGASLPPADFAGHARPIWKKLIGRPADLDREAVTQLLYPQRVFPEYAAQEEKYSDLSVPPGRRCSSTAWKLARRSASTSSRGKTLIVKYLTVSDPHADGSRTVFFELNGQPRETVVMDKSLAGRVVARARAAWAGNPLDVGAPMPGPGGARAGRRWRGGDGGAKLFTLEAMEDAERRRWWPRRRAASRRCWSRRGRRWRRGIWLLRFEG